MLIYNDTRFTVGRSAEDCCLTGQVDFAGLSYAVADEQNNCLLLKTFSYPKKNLSYDDLAQAVGLIFEQEPFLKKRYKSSKWMFRSNKAVLLPPQFAEDYNLRHCLAYAVSLNELDEIQYMPLPTHEATCVFALPSPVANVIVKNQPTTRFFHPQIPLLSLAAIHGTSTIIVVNILSEFADVALFVNGKLTLCNTYPVQAFTDVLYSLFIITKLRDIEKEKFTLYYMGQFTESDENLLHQYFKKNRRLFNNDNSTLLGSENATMYHLLLSLTKCE